MTPDNQKKAVHYVKTFDDLHEASKTTSRAKTNEKNLANRLDELRTQLGHCVGNNIPRRAFVVEGGRVVYVEKRGDDVVVFVVGADG